MTNLCKWGTTSLQTLMSGELNGMLSDTFIASVGAFDNSSTRYAYADIDVFINIPGPGAPVAGSFVSLQLLESVDGTNFPATANTFQNDVGGAMQQGIYMLPIGVAVGTPQHVVVRQVPLPPAKFITMLYQKTGANFNGTGNTVRALMYGYNFNG